MAAAYARLDGKVAVITGGTQGLGEAVARLFSARGAAGIVICGRNVANGKAVAADLGKTGCRVEYVQADLAVRDADRRQHRSRPDVNRLLGVGAASNRAGGV